MKCSVLMFVQICPAFRQLRTTTNNINDNNMNNNIPRDNIPYPDTPCMPYMPTLTPKTTPTDRHIWQSHGVSGKRHRGHRLCLPEAIESQSVPSGASRPLRSEEVTSEVSSEQSFHARCGTDEARRDVPM